MLLASFMSDGCRVKLRLVPGEENSFLAQFSLVARGSSTALCLDGHSDVEPLRSATEIKQFEGKMSINMETKLHSTI